MPLRSEIAPLLIVTQLEQFDYAGAATIGQDAGSSLVYGMPRAAEEAGAVQRQLDLHAIPAAILAACSRACR